MKEAHQATLYTITTFVTQFGSFLVVPLFWQKLTLQDYGVIGLTEMIATFLQLFLGLSLDSSITRFYYDWPEAERRRRVGTLWVLNWAACLVTGTLAIGILWPTSAFLFPDVPFHPYLFLGLIVAILRSMYAAPYATLRIVNRPRLYAAYTLGGFAIQMSLNILFVVVLDRGLHGYFISSVIGNAVTVLLSAVLMLGFATPCLEQKGLPESLRFSLPSIPTSILSALTQITDRFLLQRFATIEALGIYTVSLKFTSLILYLHNSLKLSFIPVMVKGIAKDRVAGIAAIVRSRRFYMLPLVIGSMCIAIFIHDFVRLAGQPEYLTVARWIPWLIGPVLISTLTLYYAPGLFLAKRTDLTWIPQLIQLGVVVTAGAALIPALSLSGVVISRYASTLALFGATLFLSKRVWPMADEWGTLAGMLSVAVVATVLASMVDLESVWLNIAVHFAILAGAVAVLGYVVVGSVAGFGRGLGAMLAGNPPEAVTGRASEG